MRIRIKRIPQQNSRNARKWKHGDGGNLYLFGGEDDNNPRPVTTSGTGYIPNNYGQSSIDYIRNALYKNITPFGYHKPIQRVTEALLGKQDEGRVGENVMINSGDAQASALDAIWGTYLNIPINQRRKIKSNYNLSKTTGGYYRFNDPGLILDFNSDLSPQGLYAQEGRKAIQMNAILGNHTVGLGRDKRGDYIYYSDSNLNKDGSPNLKTGWDINPYSNTVDESTEETTESHGQYGQSKNDISYKIGKALFGNTSDLSMGIGTPVPIYDKVYLDDYYKVPNDYRGGMYLPEVTIVGKKKKKALGGNLFDDGGSYSYTKPLDNIFVDEYGNLLDPSVPSARGTILLPDLEVTASPIDVGRGEAARVLENAFIESNDATATPYSTNSHLDYKGIEGMTQAAAWMKDHPTLNNVGMALGTTPFAVAGYPAFMTVGEGVTTALTNPYVDTALTSGFGAHGLDHAINEGIDGWGDAAMTALEVSPLGRLAKPVYNTITPYINSAYNKLPWTYRIPENSNMAYRRMGPLERDWIMEGNELSTRETNALTEAEEEAAKLDPKYTTKSGFKFNLFKAGAEHGGRKQFAKGQPWKGTTVTHGEEQVLAIPGEGLPWVSGRHYLGPQGRGFKVGDISFEEAPFGSHIDLLTEEGYSGVNPSLLDGSVIYSPYKIFSHNFGYKKLYPKNATRTPQIIAENAASITPEQWTAAQDAAIARGDMAEAQRLRDLHFKIKAPETDVPDQFHGTHYDDLGNQILLNKGSEQGTNGVGFYTSSNKPYARKYGPNIFKFKVNAKTEDLAQGRFAYLSENKMNELKAQGYKGTIDDTSGPMLGAGRDAVEYTFFDPNIYKSANAVTYDDNGVRIPLGERDNFNINDIRYGLLPFLGLGAAGTLYGKNKKGRN